MGNNQSGEGDGAAVDSSQPPVATTSPPAAEPSQSGQADAKVEDEITFANRNRQKTFNMKKGSMRFQKGMTLKANLAATLQGQVDVKNAVKLPDGEDINEWIAINSKARFA